MNAWDIETDESLLEFLEGFSARMLRRMRQTSQGVDELVYDTNRAEVDLYNVFNAFTMLSNT